jgi:Ca-activated chloride channel family protein
MKNFIKLMLVLALVAVTAGAATTRNITVSGTVTDENNCPLIGATVIEKGTQNADISKSDGTYSISVPKGATLVFSLSGYITQEHKVTGATLNAVMKVELEPLRSTVQFVPPTIVEYEVVGTDDALGVDLADLVMQEELAVAEYGNAEKTRIFANSSTQAAIYDVDYDNMDAEEYTSHKENRFNSVSRAPLSTFSLDVDGASYSNARRMINAGQLPPQDAIRVEEFINYFSYDYPQPTGSDPVKITTEVGACPWNTDHRLVSIGVKAKEIPSDNLPNSNFVFLIDVSGSMYDRLDMVKSSMKLLVNNLRDEDRVAIVVYAGAAGLKLESTSGSDKQKIREALDELTAGGSTAGGAGIKLAYQVARKNFIEGGNNRVILCTDGDFNVGVSSNEGLESLIESERKSGVFLTVLGYGMGNYKDAYMQTLAEKGNGNHAYIDNMQEANRVLVGEFGSTMYAVAKDVKIQVEFNPATVQSYRLVGYESRLLRDEDFNDDTVDAGELGAGHTVTALYEIVPAGVAGAPGSIDPLKYQPAETGKSVSESGELMTVKLRYKAPDGDTSKLISTVVKDNSTKSNSTDFNFTAAAAMFAQLLRDSDFKGDATYDMVVRYAERGLGNDARGYRRELVRLAETAEQLTMEN